VQGVSPNSQNYTNSHQLELYGMSPAWSSGKTDLFLLQRLIGWKFSGMGQARDGVAGRGAVAYVKNTTILSPANGSGPATGEAVRAIVAPVIV
jgi:hypothetical protein